MTTDGEGKVFWKHVGLHGHSVGTFACDEGGIKWKSAIAGGEDLGGSVRTIPKAAIAGLQWTVFGRSGHLRVQTSASSKLHHELRFDGFPVEDFDLLRETFKKNLGADLSKYAMSSNGTQYGISRMAGKKLTYRHCVLEDADEEGEEFEIREGDEMLSLDLAEVSQCVLPGNNRNEIELQFPESDAVEVNNDQLVSVRFYIPPDPDTDPGDRTTKTPAELLQQRIMSTANIRKTTGDVIVEFDHEKGSFLTPRGRYSIELYDQFFRMRGQKYDYKIKYDDISRLFLLPKPDDVHMAFVIALDKPIRQGQQRYQHLVLQTTKDPDEVRVNLDEETLKKEYDGDLQPVMRGSLSNLVAKTFKVTAKKKVFIPGNFANANQQPCVKCALRANEGLLYPLEKQFVFIHKPPVLIRFNEVESVEFQRYSGGQLTNRNFDLAVNLKSSATLGDGKQEYLFSGIDKSDYAGLYNFLSGRKIKIKNLTEPGAEPVAAAPVYNEDEIYGGPDDGMEDESDDESYDAANAAEDEEPAGSESDMDSDEMGSEVDDDLDSDLEEARGGDGKKSSSSKKSKKRPAEKDDSPAKKKAKKDPNAPKKPMSSYMFYMNTNRSRVKEENADATFGDIARLVAAEFKELTAEQKEKYEKMAQDDKERYQKEMESYEPPKGFEKSGKTSSGKATEAKKGKGKAKKDPNAPKRGMTSFMMFSNSIRSKVKEDNPDASFGDIGRMIGAKFKELTPDEKKKYEDMAKADKERYEKEMKAYKIKKADEEAAAKDDDDDSDSDDDSDVKSEDDDDDDSDSDSDSD